MARAYHNFQQTVWRYYQEHGRHDLPWRVPEADGSFDPYSILVSEIMLQQTQVPRVIPKFEAFIRDFPTIQVLAAASLGVVLVSWQGLGYNRRAKFLWLAAQKITAEYGGIFPQTLQGLVSLPGVGINTAGAVLVYAYDVPVAFIETNIRTVFIHHFFSDESGVLDRDIMALVKETLPGTESDCSVRQWYWALMDYGTHLKQTVGNISRASKGYAKQSKFVGSVRELRGKTLRLLAAGPMQEQEIVDLLHDLRTQAMLHALLKEGLIRHHNGLYELP